MPYIKQEERNRFDPTILEIVTKLTTQTAENKSKTWDAGSVNYIITKILMAWFRSGKNYSTICQIMGTLSCVAQEFYRRVATEYEIDKSKQNGDVF